MAFRTVASHVGIPRSARAIANPSAIPSLHAWAILRPVRPLLILLAAVLTSCAPAPAPTSQITVQSDPVAEPWYAAAVAQLSGLNRQAESALASGKADEAASVIQKAQPLAARLLAVSKPTLAAMEAVSDSDQIYARMLLGNKHYGWARMLFQKNLARWKNWQPQTEETARRRKLAEAGIAECDRELLRP